MPNNGRLYKTGLGRASRFADMAAKDSEKLTSTFSEISQRYIQLAEQQEGTWWQGSMQHHRKVEKLKNQVRDLRQKAHQVLQAMPSRRQQKKQA